MKCMSCGEQISPKFVAAIRDNVCPACGSEMMSQGNYKRIFEVERQLRGLGFDKNLMFGVAAALASRFTLVPRDLALPEDEEVESGIELTEDDLVKRGPRPKKPIRNKRSDKMRKEIEEQLKEEEELADIPPEQREEIIKAYGMDAGNKENISLSSFEGSDVDEGLVEAISDIPLEGMSGGPASGVGRLDQAGAEARHSALLARAEQAKLRNPGIKRMS